MPFLKERLKPVAPLDAKRVDRLIADLGSEQMEPQDNAIAELEKSLELADAALRAHLSGKPAAEVRKRIEDLLSRPLPPADGDTLRGLRGVEALEKIGTAEARAVIEPLARGAPGARLTQDAAATLKRIRRGQGN